MGGKAFRHFGSMASSVAASGECGKDRGCDEVATGKGGCSDAKSRGQREGADTGRGAEGSRMAGEKGAAGGASAWRRTKGKADGI
jgi:hypothetical protein